MQECGRGGDAATCLGTAGRAFEVDGDLLIGPRGGAGTVPRPSVRVGLGVGGIGEGTMHPVAIMGSRRAVGGRPDEWVSELRSPTDGQQPGVSRGLGRSHVDLEVLGGSVEQDGVADGLCRRGQDEESRVGREPVEAPHVAVFDPSGDRMTLGQPEPACQFGEARGAGELE